ncbi:P-loop containing nucleoside triphosphate hydrolase protein [Trametes maxima]|nr:P-loop containing nucleoside triphosphate hydrolase protein [Trametes maxima]
MWTRRPWKLRNGKKVPAVGEPEGRAPPSAKYLDRYINPKTDLWVYTKTTSTVPAEAYLHSAATETPPGSQDCCFTAVRKLPDPTRDPYGTIEVYILLKCEEFLKVLSQLAGNIAGVSWNDNPVRVSLSAPLVVQGLTYRIDRAPLLITFLPELEQYRDTLATRSRSDDEEHIMGVLDLLLKYLRENYGMTLSKITHLTSYGEISYDLLYAILVPRSLVVARCAVTGEQRVYRLLSATKGLGHYRLTCLSICAADPPGRDSAVKVKEGSDADARPINEASARNALSRQSFGTIITHMGIPRFDGVHKINSLSVYPLQYDADPPGLKARLVERGTRWVSLQGMHHVQYNGRGVVQGWSSVTYNVDSRIMLDRTTWKTLDANYSIPTPDAAHVLENTDQDDKHSLLTDEELLIASPILYGFGLSDKIWLEFNVESITPISWNPEAFEGLVLPSDRKNLLRSLVEAHNAGATFDDFVRGKGQGLVINLFGPPAGDLGTTPSALDSKLERIFEIATRWNAIVLIDEADVFLEERSLHDILRNAMVAVFLRHIEYYRGILFLTTNRIGTFDEAFLSRIHVALHFDELSTAAKVQIWRAFLKKVGAAEDDIHSVLLQKLAERDVNGRQIKNACRTATSIARSRGEKLQYEHLAEALDAMEEFVVRFAAMKSKP